VSGPSRRSVAKLTDAVHHQVEHLLRGQALQQCGPHVGDRGQPRALHLRCLVQAGVGDRDTGGSGQRREDGLVLGGEHAVALRGEVEIAEDLPAAADRDAQEAAHPGMVRREADRRRVLPQIVQPERPWLGGQLAQHTLPLGEMPHPCGELLVHADMDERDQRPVRPQDAESPVAGVDQLGGRLDDAPQGHVQVQPGGDTEEGVEQTLHAFLGASDGA
jgi:hypothetical protein